MFAFVQFLTLAWIVVQIPSALAGAACVQQHKNVDECIAECSQRWGWPGSVMGNDRWGAVMVRGDFESVGAAVGAACGALNAQPSGGLVGNVGGDSSDSTGSTLSPNSAATLPTQSPSTVTSFTTTYTTSWSTSFSATTISPHQTAPSTSRPAGSSTSSVESSSSGVEPPTSDSVNTPTKTTKQPVQSSTTSPSSPPSSSTGGTSDSSNADIDQYLSTHNTIRSQHGASPLSWNNTLAIAAQKWADHCEFTHSGGELGPFGENLAAGNGGSYNIASAVKSWTDESSEYDPNNPQASHFTQVVWKATTQLGCAVASCTGILDGTAKFYVCEYFPAGNVENPGMFAQNVQA